jgi:hypothetical protein
MIYGIALPKGAASHGVLYFGRRYDHIQFSGVALVQWAGIVVVINVNGPSSVLVLPRQSGESYSLRNTISADVIFCIASLPKNLRKGHIYAPVRNAPSDRN